MARLILFIFLICGAVPALAGSVKTRDGKTREGKVAIDADKLILTPDKGGAKVTVALADVVAATFDPAPSTKPTTRPAGWVACDIGKCNRPGEFTITGDRFVLKDSAFGLKTASRKKGSESIFFVCQRVSGDATIVARFRQTEEVHSVRAGVMIRASLDDRAPFAMVARGVEGETRLIRRAIEGSDADVAATSPQRVLGASWLKLQRQGYTFSAFESTDGQKWQAIGTAEIPMEEEVHIGLAAATATSTYPERAPGGRTLFDKVQLTAQPGTTGNGSGGTRSPRGIALTSGSLIAAEVESADENSIAFNWLEGPRRTLPMQHIVRCTFIALLPTHEEKLKNSPAGGIMLINGDFLEGQFKGIEEGRLKITSVLFGAKNIDARHEAAALVVRSPAAQLPACSYELRLSDRSVLRAKTLGLTASHATIDEPILGPLKIPIAQLAELRRIEKAE